MGFFDAQLLASHPGYPAFPRSPLQAAWSFWGKPLNLRKDGYGAPGMDHSAPRTAASRRVIACLAASIATLLPVSGQEVWSSPLSGRWSEDLRWLDGSAPQVGGDEALSVRFENSVAVVADLDLGGFSLHRLELGLPESGSLQVTAVSGNALRFAGTNPELSFSGFAPATITAPVLLASPVLRIGGGGFAQLLLNGSIGEEGGSRRLRVEMNAMRADLGAVQVSGANTFSGGVELENGNLFLNHSSALGTGTFTVRGGTLRLGAIGLENNAVLASDLVISDAANATWSGSMSGAASSAGLSLRGGVADAYRRLDLYWRDNARF